MNRNAGKTVREILKAKKGSIKQAGLGKGSPSWDEILDSTWEEIVERCDHREPGYQTIRKLLGDKEYDK